MNKKFEVYTDFDFGRNKRQTVASVGLAIKESGKDILGKYHCYTGYGATIRSQQDKDKPEVGIKLALAEALEQLAREIKKDAWSQIHKKSPKPLSDAELYTQYEELLDELLTRMAQKQLTEEAREKLANTEEAIAKREERKRLRENPTVVVNNYVPILRSEEI